MKTTTLTQDQGITLAMMVAGVEAGVETRGWCHDGRLTELGKKGMLEYDRDEHRYRVTEAGRATVDQAQVDRATRRFARSSYHRVERLARELAAAEDAEHRWRVALAPEPCDMCGAAVCSDKAECDNRRADYEAHCERTEQEGA